MDVWLNHIDLILIFGVFAVSLNLLLGHAGVLSSGHAALGAVGGYTATWLVLRQGWNPWLAIVVGVVAAALVGLLIALPSLPLTAEYLILLTLVAGEALLAIIAANNNLGGTFGLSNLPDVTLFGWALGRARDWFVPLLLILAVVFLVCRRVGESPYGRILRATREDDRAAAAVGVHTFAYRMSVFALTAALAGLAGGLMAMYLGVASPKVYGFDVSLAVFAMVIVGGMGNLWGSLLGAAGITLIAPVLERVVDLSPERASFVRIALYGLLLVVIVRFRPEGLLPEHRQRKGEPAADAPPADLVVKLRDDRLGEAPTVTSGRDVLTTSGLSKRFGGVVAADALDLVLPEGTITALVGPNGAGKTTVFNLITGYIPPDAGRVTLHGVDLSGKRPDEIARSGIARTFQDVRLWNRMTVLDNVAVAVPGQPAEHLRRLFTPGSGISAREREVRDKARTWLSFVGLADRAGDLAGSLSYGQSKLVSLARAMAADAPVVLLDEPVSGVDAAWAEVMLELVEAMRHEGRTICIVEHNLHVVQQLADRVYFMDLGRIVAEGTFDELTSSPELASLYFGTKR